MKHPSGRTTPVRGAAVVVFFRNIADALALTTAERRVLQFLLAGFVAGLGVQLVRGVFASPTKFDYSAQDSTFAALSVAPEHSGGPDNAPENEADGTDNAAPAGPVRVNTAPKAELMRLPGIGEVMAERIMLDRQDNGPFRSVEDLARVRGIGSRRVEQLRPLVIID